jgi:hypothetical protein
MRGLVRIIGILVAMLAWSGSGAFAQPSHEREKFESWQRNNFELVDVSLPASFKLTPPERIQAFRVLVMQGVVQRIYTPYEWDITIDNSSEAVGDRTEVQADYDVGAAAFDNNGMGYFQDFMTVAWLKEERYRDIMVELTIETIDDHVKKIKFHDQQLVLTPTNRPFHPF